MNENITSRVGRIVSGGLNALVDAVEGSAPTVVMEQAIREIDGVVDEVRVELGRVLANRHLTARRLAHERALHDELASRIETAIGSDREDLAEPPFSLQ